MSLTLKEILTLVGRLDDTPGFDTPRERFRRFITEHATDVAGVRVLLAQCQDGLGDQHRRARHDLIVMLGGFLGFEVTFGPYDTHYDARSQGHWRSRRRARIVVEVRSEETADSDVEALASTVATLSSNAPAGADERWVGLCVTTLFYAARRRLEALLEQRGSRDIRCVTVDSLLWLAESAAAERLAHEDALRLLTSGPDSDLMIDLMRRFTDAPVAAAPAPPAPPASRESRPTSETTPHLPTTPHLSIVGDRERDTRFWLSSLSNDDAATPEQVLDSVVRGRRLLGIADVPWPAQAQPGDWVCFLIEGAGIVGHAQLDAAVADPSSVIRDAHRYGVVFRLKNVSIYDVPNTSVEGVKACVDRMPVNSGAASLAPLSRSEYETLTRGTDGDLRLGASLRD